MPRYARQTSGSKVYHIMLRGIDRMSIFLDYEDMKRFIETIDKMKKNGEYELYAYCLMGNHVHLLIKEGRDSIQRCMKRIGVSYAYYYNRKYDRVGHLFQDRFRSENIEDNNYLLAAARYIHRNPVKAGMVNRAEDYPWSSYREYINSGRYQTRINIELVLGLFSDNKQKAIDCLKIFTEETTQEEFIDIGNKVENPQKPVGKTKDTAETLLLNFGFSLVELREMEDKKKRNEIIKRLKGSTGASVRELSSILGLSKDIICRAH